jgi:hypothetical protein
VKKLTLEQQLKNLGLRVWFETSQSDATGTSFSMWIQDKGKICLNLHINEKEIRIFDCEAEEAFRFTPGVGNPRWSGPQQIEKDPSLLDGFPACEPSKMTDKEKDLVPKP